MNQLQFDNIRTFDDWDIYLSSYKIGDAEPKEVYVDLPSGDGSIDLTEALTGEVSYGDRFFEAVLTFGPPRSGWIEKLNEIRSFLNGRTRKLVEPIDTDHYYIGRFKTDFESEGVLGLLTLTGTLKPYKYKNSLTVRNITLPASGTSNLTLKNSRKRVIPTITTDKQITIKFNNQTRTINAGEHRLTSLVLVEGENKIHFTGTTGTKIDIEYQEGAL